MLVIRPIQESDYPALLACAEESGHGFTSLPVDEELLRSRIAHSVQSFASNATKPGDEGYLMVAEDTQTGEIAGTTGIEAAVGLTTPFYTYHINTQVHHSSKLDIHNAVKLLVFGNNYTGTTELCTLFLREKFRQGNNGKLLSKSRFLMLAQFADKFSDNIFAEMRGVSDKDGNSPFWQWLQTHFFSIDFTEAVHLVGTGQKRFIAELMPKYPIYINLLSEEARAVIGQVHEQTRPALRLLENEGFSCRDHVDIFDAGPTVECKREHIHSVKNSFTAQVVIDNHSSAQDYLLSNTDFQNFRATIAKVAIDKAQNRAIISDEVAKALQLKANDTVRLVSI